MSADGFCELRKKFRPIAAHMQRANRPVRWGASTGLAARAIRTRDLVNRSSIPSVTAAPPFDAALSLSQSLAEAEDIYLAYTRRGNNVRACVWHNSFRHRRGMP